MAKSVQAQYDISERHSGRLIGLMRTTMRYKARGQDDTALRMRIKELETYVR